MCREEVVPIGEKVFFKRLKESGSRKNVMGNQWETGIWLGHARASNETIMDTSDGVVRAWAVKRMEEGSCWNGEDIKNMRGTPQRPNPNMPGIDVPKQISAEPKNPEGEADDVRPPRCEARPRGAYLKPKDVKEVGYTDDCEGCRRLRTGNMEMRPHTKECREGMEERLRQRDDPRWKRADNSRKWAVASSREPENAELAEPSRTVGEASEETVRDQIPSSSSNDIEHDEEEDKSDQEGKRQKEIQARRRIGENGTR